MQIRTGTNVTHATKTCAFYIFSDQIRSHKERSKGVYIWYMTEAEQRSNEVYDYLNQQKLSS